MKQSEEFIKKRDKVRQIVKINKLNISAYSKKKIQGLRTFYGINQDLIEKEVIALDLALKTVQEEIQQLRNELNK